MKKFLYFIFICTLCVGFTACGEDDDPKEEEFLWNGDWNDPNDRNYKPEGYNPIQGIWKRDNERGLYFSEDRIAYDVYFLSNGSYVIENGSGSGSKYTINNTAFKYSHSQNTIFKWSIKDNILHTFAVGIDTNGVYYTKVEE